MDNPTTSDLTPDSAPTPLEVKVVKTKPANPPPPGFDYYGAISGECKEIPAFSANLLVKTEWSGGAGALAIKVTPVF